MWGLLEVLTTFRKVKCCACHLHHNAATDDERAKKKRPDYILNNGKQCQDGQSMFYMLKVF